MADNEPRLAVKVAALSILGLGVAIPVAFTGGVIYVVAHFIHKYW